MHGGYALCPRVAPTVPRMRLYDNIIFYGSLVNSVHMCFDYLGWGRSQPGRDLGGSGLAARSVTPSPQRLGRAPSHQGGVQWLTRTHSSLAREERRKWPIVLLILGVLFVVGIGGCAALLNSASNEVQKQDDRSAPRDVAVGAAFTIGKHQTLAGWKVVNEAGMFSVVGKVKNVSDATSHRVLPPEVSVRDRPIWERGLQQQRPRARTDRGSELPTEREVRQVPEDHR